MIDNYDSFTYNLFQYIEQIVGDVKVYRNDEITIDELDELNPDAIVLSPGPGTPRDSGVCKEVLLHFVNRVPILGICLGHQIIVETFGGTITKGAKPMHGKVSMIQHDGKTVFRNVENPTMVTRYHSLIAESEKLPKCLEISAESADGTIMAVRHKEYSIEGIQFHPEAILTEMGYEMLTNFFKEIRVKGGIQYAE